MSNTINSEQQEVLDQLIKGNVTVQEKKVNEVPKSILKSDNISDFTNKMEKKINLLSAKSLGIGAGLIMTIAMGTGLLINAGNNLLKLHSSEMSKLIETAQQVNNEPVNKVEEKSILDNIKSTFTSDNKSVDNYNGKEFKLFNTKTDKYQISNEVKENVENVAKFDIPSNLAPNQMARHAARVKFQQGMANKSPMDLELSFLSEMEGYVGAQPYKDNIGWAIGSGWNLSLQNSNYNRFLSSTITDNPDVIKSLTSYSGTSNSVNPGKIPAQIEYQRFSQVSMIMLNKFKEDGVYPALGNALKQHPKGKEFYQTHGNNPVEAGREFFKTLPATLQAPASYLSYNAGSEGYKKFKTFNNSIVDYAFTPENNRTAEQRQTIVNSGTPTFVLNGQRMENTKFKQLFASLFNSDNGLAYGAYVKANPAPRNMASYFNSNSNSTPSSSNTNNNGQVTVNPANLSGDGQWQVADPIGDARREALKNGTKLNMHLDYSQFLPDEKPAVKKPRRGIPAAWG